MAIKRLTRAGGTVRFPLLCDPDLQAAIFNAPIEAANKAVEAQFPGGPSPVTVSKADALAGTAGAVGEAWLAAFKKAEADMAHRVEMFADSLNPAHLGLPDELVNQATHVTIKALDGRERHDILVHVSTVNPELLSTAKSNGLKLASTVNLEVAQRSLIAIDGFDERPVKDADGIARYPLAALLDIREYGSFINEVAARMETVSTLGERLASPCEPS